MVERILLCPALILAAVFCTAVADGGQRRSDDVNALQLAERLSQDMVVLQSQLMAQNNRIDAQNNKIAAQNNVIEAQRQRIEALEAASNYTVAFCARITQPPTSVSASAGATIPFRGIITNVGGAYNPSSSAFTAPVAGQYFFIVHADCSPDYRRILVHVNGNSVFIADNDGGEDHHVTGSGLVTLEVGDVVSAVHYGSTGHIDAGIESTFTGFWVK